MFRSFVVAIVLINAFAQSPAHNSFRAPDNGRLQIPGAFAKQAAFRASGFDPRYRLSLPKPVQDKNFYLLSLFQRTPELRRLLRKNETLKQLADEKLQALRRAAACEKVSCFDDLLRFDEAAIEAAASALKKLANEPAFKQLTKGDLRPSGVFIKYAGHSDDQLLAAAWKDAANGMNRIIKVYGLGNRPRYPVIDRIGFDPSADSYRDLLKAQIAAIDPGKAPLFFEPTLNFVLKLLEVNRRDEAARYEPLEQGVNKAAVQNLKNIKWGDYAYSFILVLGSGPQDSARLSATGAERADVGAQLFLQHKAPLIILSGGHVHPMQTPYCEAIEMKKYMMEKYKIPERSILIDPYARHTTTNFRNAARLAFRYRIPPVLALVTSSEEHITSTTSEGFRTRCVNELGYSPMESIKRISPVEAEFKPSIVSLFFDSSDPLDP